VWRVRQDKSGEKWDEAGFGSSQEARRGSGGKDLSYGKEIWNAREEVWELEQVSMSLAKFVFSIGLPCNVCFWIGLRCTIYFN